MAAMMAQDPGHSLPKQMEAWPELKGAYRFLNNPRVRPEDLGAAHRSGTLQRCGGHPVVLCVQDDTEIHGVKVAGGRGGEDGEVLHSTLAVTPGGDLLGILDQRWFRHVTPMPGETQGQRAQRWRESDVWADAVTGVEEGLAGAPVGRLIHVADRAADNLRFMHECINAGRGFVVRAQHDRLVEEGTGKLWDHLAAEAPAGTLTVRIGAQRDAAGRLTRVGRSATVQVRYATVLLDPPKNHPGNIEPLTVQVVYLREEDAPAGVEAVDWMLLTSEAVASFADACVVVGYYQKRWVIEEWHRALKEGCRLEESQVQTVEALRRLSAILSVLAVRLLQLRDLAQGSAAGDAAALQVQVDGQWIEVVAKLAGREAARLTPREFWGVITRKGGFIGRKSDGQPGWKVIWRGWHDISQMVSYAEVLKAPPSPRKNCG
jgi:hypothetical protein